MECVDGENLMFNEYGWFMYVKVIFEIYMKSKILNEIFSGLLVMILDK